MLPQFDWLGHRANLPKSHLAPGIDRHVLAIRVAKRQEIVECEPVLVRHLALAPVQKAFGWRSSKAQSKHNSHRLRNASWDCSDFYVKLGKELDHKVVAFSTYFACARCSYRFEQPL